MQRYIIHGFTLNDAVRGWLCLVAMDGQVAGIYVRTDIGLLVHAPYLGFLALSI